MTKVNKNKQLIFNLDTELPIEKQIAQAYSYAKQYENNPTGDSAKILALSNVENSDNLKRYILDQETIKKTNLINEQKIQKITEEITASPSNKITWQHWLFLAWLQRAIITEPKDPNAVILSTSDANGVSNARVVLMKFFTPCGFIFNSNRESAKGQELEHNPNAHILFYWKNIGRQIRCQVKVEPASQELSDFSFRTRPFKSRVGAHISQQTKPMENQSKFCQKLNEAFKNFSHEQAIIRPHYWIAYHAKIQNIEFWCEKEFRVHERIVSNFETNNSNLPVYQNLYP